MFDTGFISENVAQSIDQLAEKYGIESNLQGELKEMRDLNEIVYYDGLKNDKKLQYLEDKRVEKTKELAELGCNGSLNLEEKKNEINKKIEENQKKRDKLFITTNKKEKLDKENEKLEQQLNLIEDIQEIDKKYAEVTNEINTTEQNKEKQSKKEISAKSISITQDKNNVMMSSLSKTSINTGSIKTGINNNPTPSKLVNTVG